MAALTDRQIDDALRTLDCVLAELEVLAREIQRDAAPVCLPPRPDAALAARIARDLDPEDE